MRKFYIGQIRSGKLHLSGPRRAQMQADIAKMKEGRYVELELRPLPRRSNPQNAYYWGVVVAEVCHALQDLGHEVDANLTHEFLKQKFNAVPLCNKDGELIGEIGDTTTRMSKSEFSEYIEKIKRFAAQYLNTVIPEAGQQKEIGFDTIIAQPIDNGILISKA